MHKLALGRLERAPFASAIALGDEDGQEDAAEDARAGGAGGGGGHVNAERESCFVSSSRRFQKKKNL